MKVYICCKTLSNHIRIQKAASKNQNYRTPLRIARGFFRKTIKLMKVLNVKRAPVTGIGKESVMDHNNRCLLAVRPKTENRENHQRKHGNTQRN